MSQHKDMYQEIQKPKIAPAENSEGDEESEHENSDSNESQSETESHVSTDDQDVWKVLLELLAFRVRNGYYGETDLNHLKKIDQIWEPPFYNDLILRLRELVQNLRRINVLIEKDPLMEILDEKKDDIRQKYLDKNLLDENGLDEMTWDRLSHLLKAALVRNQLTIEQEFFGSETESDMSTEEGEDDETSATGSEESGTATGSEESGTAEESIESEDGATGIQELGSDSHTTTYPGNQHPPPYVSP